MKIHESKPNLDIDLPNITADSTFTVWNKETKKYEKANYIKDTGLPSTSHILIYYGLTGQVRENLHFYAVLSRPRKRDLRCTEECLTRFTFVRHIRPCAVLPEILSNLYQNPSTTRPSMNVF